MHFSSAGVESIKREFGRAIGSIGVVIGLVGFFLPFYFVDGDVNTAELSTHGKKRLIEVHGYYGLIINEPANATGNVKRAVEIPVPFYLIGIIGFGIVMVKSLRRENRQRVWKVMIISSFTTLLVAFLILILATQLPLLMNLYNNGYKEEFRILSTEVSNAPLGDEKEKSIGSWGDTKLSWGFGLGFYLLILSAVIKMAGGIADRALRKRSEKQVELYPFDAYDEIFIEVNDAGNEKDKAN